MATLQPPSIIAGEFVDGLAMLVDDGWMRGRVSTSKAL
jgi:hypothetical protein